MKVETFDLIVNFEISTIEYIDEKRCSGDITRVLGHFVPQWEVLVVDWMVRREAGNDLHMNKVRLLVPENYLECEME